MVNIGDSESGGGEIVSNHEYTRGGIEFSQYRPEVAVRQDLAGKLIDVLRMKMDFMKNWIKSADILNFQEDGFNLMDRIESAPGEIMELGGPNPRTYKTLDLDLYHLQRQITVTNIDENGLKKYALSGNFRSEIQDATRIGRKKEELGAIITAALPPNVRPGMILEAERTLHSGGLLIMSTATAVELVWARALGLEPKLIKREPDPSNSSFATYSTVFEKK